MTIDPQPIASNEGLREFGIEYPTPTGPSHFCNQMLIQGDLDVVYLHFFQLRPPILLPSATDATGTPLKVTADPMTSVVMNFAKAEQFADLLQRQISALKEIRDANTSDAQLEAN
ncbi:hypothetical protein [Schlesneria sp. T3-172]|uniref:hypothetical protein n=1 Tax=Schlesneria sphaerica TaxID=3373610 RepID=UPI0037CA6ECB